jgi:low affinity Fe/Cu permease
MSGTGPPVQGKRQSVKAGEALIHVFKIIVVVFAIPAGLVFAVPAIRQWRKSGKITRYDATWQIAAPLAITAMGIFEGIGLLNGWA